MFVAHGLYQSKPKDSYESNEASRLHVSIATLAIFVKRRGQPHCANGMHESH